MKLHILHAVVAFGLAAGAWAQPVPDFSLVDVNPKSLRSRNVVSPRDYLQQVAGVYFGTAG